ncbi:MAG: hypothetical protein JKY30_09675 [Flavobacteriales bacterium]|nr:hypothetical protein [Flavobacteriales bacterium]
MRSLSTYYWEFTIGFFVIALLLYVFTIFNKRVYFKVEDEIISEKSRLNLLGLNFLLLVIFVVSVKMLSGELIDDFISFAALFLGSLFVSYWMVEFSVRLIYSKYKDFKKK